MAENALFDLERSSLLFDVFRDSICHIRVHLQSKESQRRRTSTYNSKLSRFQSIPLHTKSVQFEP